MSLFSEKMSKKREYSKYRQTAARFRYFPRSSYKYNLIQQQWHINSSQCTKAARQILPILFGKTTSNDLKNDQIRKSLNFKTATVYNLSDEKNYVKLNVRNSEKRVFRQYNEEKVEKKFDHKFVKIVECSKFKLIVDILKPLIEATINEDGCQFDIKFHNHFDILYYPKGGFFKTHKDDTSMDTLKNGINEGYQPYSLILGLTELTEEQINERKNNPLLLDSGATVTYSQFDSIFTNYENTTTLKRHLSPTTTIGTGLIFPSSMYHGANQNYHFESVKISIMILLKPKLSSKSMYSIRKCYQKINYKFESLLSTGPYFDIIKLRNAFWCKNISNSNFKNLPDNVLLHITSFLGHMKQCHCTYKEKSIIGKKYRHKCRHLNECLCGCNKCLYDKTHNSCPISNCISCDKIRIYEESYMEERNEYCNGRD